MAEKTHAEVLAQWVERDLTQAALPDRNLLGSALQELVTALAELDEPVLPFFRDFDAAYSVWLMPQLELLAEHMPVLAEGSRGQIDAMFEDYPDLHQRYVPLARHHRDHERWR